MRIANLPRYYRSVNAAVAIALLLLSLRHQSSGVVIATGVPVIEAWLMAIGIDLAMVAAELAILAGIKSAWCKSILITTLGISAWFNVLGFWQMDHTVMANSIAVILGIFVPTAIYGLVDTVNRRVPRKPRVNRRRKS